jgi:hypothetical protein
MKLEIVEYLGGDYHIVVLEEPEWVKGITPWYHDHYKDTDEWCEQTFGPQDIWGQQIDTGWKRMRNRYYFVSEDKLNWFVLRWS